jgi:hypothetical protein
MSLSTSKEASGHGVPTALCIMQRTRYKCIGCGVPLCSIGSGKVDNDCFAQAHETKERQNLVCKKYEAMQKRTTSKNKV